MPQQHHDARARHETEELLSLLDCDDHPTFAWPQGLIRLQAIKSVSFLLGKKGVASWSSYYVPPKVKIMHHEFRIALVCSILVLLHWDNNPADAFVTPRGAVALSRPMHSLWMMDPVAATNAISTLSFFAPLDFVETAASQSTMPPIIQSVEAASSSVLLSFTDQGQNLAGIFFQASLLPYLLFLYFLSFRANRISDLGNFGFQFILLFVISTIPSGILSRSIYEQSLANTDWLHGGAETLLTVANVLVVSATSIADPLKKGNVASPYPFSVHP